MQEEVYNVNEMIFTFSLTQDDTKYHKYEVRATEMKKKMFSLHIAPEKA